MQQTNLVTLTICQFMLEIRNIWFGISGTELLKNAGNSTKPFLIRNLVFKINRKSPQKEQIKGAIDLRTLPLLELVPGLTGFAMIEWGRQDYIFLMMSWLKLYVSPLYFQHLYFFGIK